MTRPRDASPASTLLERLRDAHLRRESAVVDYEVGGRGRRLWLREGALFLPGDNPLASTVRELGAETKASAWEPVLDRLAERYAEEGSTRSVTWRALDALPADAAGPVPTSALLRRTFARLAFVGKSSGSHGFEDDDPLFAASRPQTGRDDGSPACWSAEELWVVERLTGGKRYGALVAECPFGRERLRAVLAGLRTLDLVHSDERAPESPRDSGLLRLAELMRARIGASLRERPLNVLDDALHRRLAELARRIESIGHYELLGLDAAADEETVRVAFERLARMVHPSHAERPGVRVSRSELERLFERAVAAMRTLGDPALRVAYDESHGVTRGVAELDSSDRREEVAELARREFERARFEELNGDLHSALVLYEQAATLVPRAEYWMALARLQARNSAWSRRALESYRRALELAPGDAGEIRFAMAGVLERAGALDEAVSYYQAAAAASPPHEGAKRELKRLAAEGHGRDPDSGAGLGRLFRRG